MNFGKSVKKLASEFNVALSIYRSAGFCKTNSSKALGELNFNYACRIPVSAPLQNHAYVNLPLEEKFNSITKHDIPLQKKIEDPGKIIKIKIKLPVGSLKDALDLPCSIEKEIQEPIKNIISKRALSKFRKSIRDIKGKHIISIRKRKMRIHKRKKYMKKHRVALRTKRLERDLQKEYDFHMQLKAVIKNCESFSPEQYVNDTLKMVHWKKPLTRIRGILAPQWVIKEHLDKKEEQRLLNKRLEECINSRK